MTSTALWDAERTSTLRDRLAPLQGACLDAWRRARPELPRLGPPATRWQQWRTARATRQLIDEIATRVDNHPQQTTAQHEWRDALRHRLQDFGEQRFGWPDGYRRLLFGDAFYETTVAFARQARAFDPELRLDDLWQALRNVWIGNNLQMLLGRPVRLTPGLFAYSMLYPVTDNLIDAPDRTPDEKRVFNTRLGARLMGDAVTAESAAEASAFDLVSHIEQEFPRRAYADVWESILAIHHGQVASVRQHGRPLNERALREISFAKGGASVLADLYLVVGTATPAEEHFAFGYGVFLQLLDDLQDVETDAATGHQTLFTLAAREGTLDNLTARLVAFIDVVLDQQRPQNGPHTLDCLDLIRRNCHSMLAGVIAENPGMFGRRFRRSIERQWPLSFRAMRRLRTHARRRFEKTARRLQAQRGVSSPLELILAS